MIILDGKKASLGKDKKRKTKYMNCKKIIEMLQFLRSIRK